MRLSPYQSYSYPTIYYLLFPSSRDRGSPKPVICYNTSSNNKHLRATVALLLHDYITRDIRIHPKTIITSDRIAELEMKKLK